MRSKFLLFQENSNRLTTPLKIFFGPKAFQTLAERLGSVFEADAFANRLSKESSLLISVQRPNTDSEEYDIYIKDIVLRCKYRPRRIKTYDNGRQRVEDACFQVVSVRNRGFSDNNNAVKRGVRFTISGGILTTVVVGRATSWFCGNEVVNNNFGEADFESALRIIRNMTIDAAKNAYSNAEDELDEDGGEDDFEPNENLAELIELAGAYSTLENSLAEERAQKNADNIYLGILPLEIDHNTDRTSYRLRTRGLNPETFKEGTLIDIIDHDDRRHGAEIIHVTLKQKGSGIHKWKDSEARTRYRRMILPLRRE